MMRFLLTLLALLAGPSVAAQFTLGTGLDYSSGDYSGASKTQIWYVPLTGKLVSGPLSLRLTVPYLRVKAPSNVTVIIEGGAGGGTGLSGGEGEGEDGGGSGGGTTTTSANVTTREGLGDVVLSLAYNLWTDSRLPVGLDVGSKIKFGTADTAKGLGTGKNDYSLYTELFRVWDNKLDTFINVGYRWYGDTASANYRNTWLLSTGLAYPLSKALSVGVDYGYRQRLLAGLDAASEATAYLNYRFPSGHKLQFYTAKGFTQASPDWGGGASFAIPF